MALITSHSPANRVIENGLTVTYSRQRITGTWSWSNSLNGGGTLYAMQEFHRYATKRYRYVGMTDAAKDACVAAMKGIYARTVKSMNWLSSGSWSTPQDAGLVMTSRITPVRNDDGSWDVEIDVNEDDVRYGLENDTGSAIGKFAFEQGRSYDGEEEVLPTEGTEE